MHELTRKSLDDFNLVNYNFHKLVEERWNYVKDANLKEQIEKFKIVVKEGIGCLLDQSDAQFIHFDGHSGNLIFNNDLTYFIDWDECGTGHNLLDLAVPCTHLMRDADRSVKLRSLLAGYGENIDKRTLNLFTIAKFLYSMTHIPTRLDILQEPEKIFKRYIEYFNTLVSEY